ncbi:hypothetical protein CHS0354_006623 [Potamilus streckersoni]|uniref:Uncharacterized protein n=1 Tax=Potamilus streckersoni TaxID=2493646 RepID=A0AAE0W2X1_9BIVA|nr:hypothetical protein CHS0354_006623 [Potamilus streckersoni]
MGNEIVDKFFRPGGDQEATSVTVFRVIIQKRTKRVQVVEPQTVHSVTIISCSGCIGIVVKRNPIRNNQMLHCKSSFSDYVGGLISLTSGDLTVKGLCELKCRSTNYRQSNISLKKWKFVGLKLHTMWDFSMLQAVETSSQLHRESCQKAVDYTKQSSAVEVTLEVVELLGVT